MALPVSSVWEQSIRHSCYDEKIVINSPVWKFIRRVVIGSSSKTIDQSNYVLETQFANSVMADTARPSNELDHPEVLSRERLMEILCERSMNINELIDMEKQDLIQLFYKFVSPLPQRIHQLRRGKRAIPCSRDKNVEEMSKEKNSKIIRLAKRRSSDSNGSFLSKMAKAEIGNITKINNALPILEVVNDGTSSVCIKSTSTATVDRTCPDVKPKVVKLNRGTLGLNLNKSVDEAVKRNKSTGYRHTEDKLTSQDATSPDRCKNFKSNDIATGDNSTKSKFKRVAVTWP